MSTTPLDDRHSFTRVMRIGPGKSKVTAGSEMVFLRFDDIRIEHEAWEDGILARTLKATRRASAEFYCDRGEAVALADSIYSALGIADPESLRIAVGYALDHARAVNSELAVRQLESLMPEEYRRAG